MNLAQINEWRVAHGLGVLVPRDTRTQKRAQSANHAARRAANQELKAKRGSNRK